MLKAIDDVRVDVVVVVVAVVVLGSRWLWIWSKGIVLLKDLRKT